MGVVVGVGVGVVGVVGVGVGVGVEGVVKEGVIDGIEIIDGGVLFLLEDDVFVGIKCLVWMEIEKLLFFIFSFDNFRWLMSLRRFCIFLGDILLKIG